MVKIVEEGNKAEVPASTEPATPVEFSTEKLSLWRRSILDAIGVRVVRPGPSETPPADSSGLSPGIGVGVNTAAPVVGSAPATGQLPATVAVLSPAALPPLIAAPPRRRGHYRRYAVFAAMLFLVLYGGFFVLRLDRRYPSLAWWLPWPVMYVDGEVVSWRELQTSIASRQQYLNQAGALEVSALDVERQAVDAWIEARAVDLAIARYGVPFRNEVVEQEYKNIEQSFGTAAALDDFLQQSYQLGVAEFRAQVLMPLMKRTMLEQHLSKESGALMAAQERIAELRRQLQAGELSFADAARVASDDAPTADLGGDLGWFELASARSEFARELAKMHVGEVSQPIQTELGYHLLKLEEVAEGQAVGEAGTLHVAHILVKPVAIERWLAAAVSRLRVVRFLPL